MGREIMTLRHLTTDARARSQRFHFGLKKTRASACEGEGAALQVCGNGEPWAVRRICAVPDQNSYIGTSIESGARTLHESQQCEHFLVVHTEALS
jgi:hypothetical protein